MGRKNTESQRMIRSLCMYYQLDEQDIYERSKMLLNAFRPVCWSVLERIGETSDEIMSTTASADLDGALIYLEQFAPDCQRDFFESKVASLFKDRELMAMAEAALKEVRRFPGLGDTYFMILLKGFFDKVKHNENEMMDMLDLERSRFYDRKREAVKVFGIALWGIVLRPEQTTAV